MEIALFTCFGTVVGLVGAILIFIYVVIPSIGHVFGFLARFIRFLYQEMRDVLLVPIALVVCAIKLLRALLCVILARWDIVHTETKAAKRRFLEAWNRTVAIFVDNPLRVFAIETKSTVRPTPRYAPSSTVHQFINYTLVGTLPTGGSGAKLYVAQPNNGSKQVVIKCFDISSGSQLPQIVRESRAMESAKKLGLVIEHHLDENRFWYATPYHAGDHLGVMTNKIHGNGSKLSEAQLQTVMSYQHALLHTLQEYHRAGLWHKDVKPDNIIIHDGTAHLVDLGLVTPLGSAMTLTTHGTEYFRDPELVRQANRGVKVHQIDGSKFDVYGAGAVLYFMLENTFPAQGGLSSFSKQSPESIRWIVRRAMADYDKRYASIDEMLEDVETVLSAASVTGVRPADLPSMGGEPPKTGVRRLPARSTPSTGGGPFPATKYRTKPLGIIVLLLSIVVGVAFIVKENQPDISPNQNVTEIQLPSGRVLVVNELSTSQNNTARKFASNKIAELGVAGWDLFIDEEKEASVRSWLPADPLSAPISKSRFSSENISGILLVREDEETKPTIYFVDQNGAHLIP